MGIRSENLRFWDEDAVDLETLSKDDLQLGMVASLSITDPAGRELVFEDAPVFHVAVWGLTALAELRRPDSSASNTDFYGEFDLVLQRRGESLSCRETGRGVTLHFELTGFRSSVLKWIRGLSVVAEARHPELASNSDFVALEASLLGAVKDLEQV